GEASWSLPVRSESLTDAGTVAFLGVRQQHPDVDVAVTLDVSALAEGETAGLVARQSERDHTTIEVTRTGDGSARRIVQRRGAEVTVLNESMFMPGDVVALGIRARGYDYELLGDGTRLGIIDGRQLDASSTGGFLGVWFGVFATSDGRPP